MRKHPEKKIISRLRCPICGDVWVWSYAEGKTLHVNSHVAVELMKHIFEVHKDVVEVNT